MPDSFENIEEYESDSDVEVDSDILDEWLNNGKVKMIYFYNFFERFSLKMHIFAYIMTNLRWLRLQRTRNIFERSAY